jgi:hypothetical protein
MPQRKYRASNRRRSSAWSARLSALRPDPFHGQGFRRAAPRLISRVTGPPYRLPFRPNEQW